MLAFAGAPMSVDALMWTGIDHPDVIGFQLAVAVSGATGMALAIAAAAWWRWVLVAGVLAVGVALAIDPPPEGGLSARVRSASDSSTVDPAIAPLWGGVLAAASGALLIAVLCAARRATAGSALAGVAACAGYFGVSLSGALRDEGNVRLAVVAVAAVVAVWAAVRSAGEVVKPSPGASVVLLTALPTAAVAVSGEAVLGTSAGLVIGLVLVAAAVLAAGQDRLLVAGLGLLLTAPFTLLVLLHSVVAGEIWYAWPIAGAGVLAGVATARFAPLVVAVAIIPTALLAFGGVDGAIGKAAVWAFLALMMAALAASATAAARVAINLPVLAALTATAAVGIGHVLAFVGAAEAGFYGALGRGGQIAVIALAATPVLLHLGGAQKKESSKSAVCDPLEGP